MILNALQLEPGLVINTDLLAKDVAAFPYLTDCKLYRHGRAAYGSINNLVKESGLSRKKVELFLHSKNSYTKYRQAKKKFPRLAVYAKHKNEIWCADLAQVDKLAEWNNGIKYLLVVVDVFSRYVRVDTLRNKSAESIY